MSVYFVNWSGGLDSTYLVQKLLQEGNEVIASYVYIENNSNKTKRELNAIEKMLPIFNAHKNFSYTGSWFKTRFNFEFVDAQLVTQKLSPPISKYEGGLDLKLPLFFIMNYFYSNVDVDYYALGYVMNDCAISYLDEIRDIFNSIKKISSYRAEIVFPIIKYNKEYIINSIHKDLIDHVTFCESPYDDDFCGECPPCLRMKNSSLKYHFFDYKKNNVSPDKFNLAKPVMMNYASSNKEEEIIEEDDRAIDLENK